MSSNDSGYNMYCEADQQFSLTGSDVVVYKNPHHVDDASSPTETYNIRYYSSEFYSAGLSGM